MQLFAWDFQQRAVAANRASKQTDYICPECLTIVHVRGGTQRQNHFYHLESSRNCRQNGKSLEHLHLQLFLLHQLPPGECFLEHRFPNGRIADAFWLQQKLVFEIQCSPMSSLEALQRTNDYKSVGFAVVWILHDKRYNRYQLSALELFLQQQPHYFSDFNSEGKGMIYDQFALIQGGCRQRKLKRRPIDLAQPKRLSACKETLFSRAIQKKLSASNLYFANDVIACYLDNSTEEQQHYALEARKLEQQKGFDEWQELSLMQKMEQTLKNWLIRPYRLLFQMLLEKMCK